MRVNVARGFSPTGTREQVAKRFDDLPGKDSCGGPTGVGDDWVRVGPIKMFLDGGMLNGTAYMRQPWPKGPTYQVTEDDYRGLLFIPQDQLRMVVEEGAKRKWQMTAHTAGEGGDGRAARRLRVRRPRHADQGPAVLHHARQLPVEAQPGAVQEARRGRRRAAGVAVQGRHDAAEGPRPGAGALVPAVQELAGVHDRSAAAATTCSGSTRSTRPTRGTRGWASGWPCTGQPSAARELFPEEALTREQAIRLYTINNAYLHHEEKAKGSLEVGKLGDLIVIDRDVLTCPAKDVAETKVLLTVVGGKVVYEKKG